jgi:hypothetical protein
MLTRSLLLGCQHHCCQQLVVLLLPELLLLLLGCYQRLLPVLPAASCQRTR